MGEKMDQQLVTFLNKLENRSLYTSKSNFLQGLPLLSSIIRCFISVIIISIPIHVETSTDTDLSEGEFVDCHTNAPLAALQGG